MQKSINCLKGGSVFASLALVFSASSLFVPVVGQAAALEEIVVTARKRDESLQDVSDQVTVFTSSSIEDAGIGNLDDIATLTPGAYFSGDFFAGENVLTLRGSGQSANQAPPASFTIDGVTLQSSLLFVQPLLDIEQVEVLRGPQGTLYGRNSLGGAINIRTKAPTDEFEGKVVVKGQEGSDISIQGSVSGPLSDTFKYRLTGSWQDRDGIYQSDLNGHDVANREARFGRLKLLWEPSDSVSVDWRFAVNREELHPLRFQQVLWPNGISEVQGSSTLYTGFCVLDPVNGFTGGTSLDFADLTPAQQGAWGAFAGVLGAGGDVCPTDNLPGEGIFQQPDLPDARNDWESFTQNLIWDMGNGLTLTSTTDYTTSEVEGAAWVGYGRSQFAPAINIDYRDTLTQELRLSGGDDTGFQWTAGLFYQDVDRDQRTIVGQGFSGGQIAENDLQPGDDTVTGREADPALFVPVAPTAPISEVGTGVFFNALIDLSDTLELNIGARYDEVEVEVDPFTDPRFVNKETFSDFQPKVSLAWTATDSVTLYATYSEGFRPGVLNPTDAFTPGSNVAEAEKLDNIEFGFKSRLGDSVILNGAVYSLDIENWQYLNFSPNAGGRFLLFAPEAETFGAELELQWQVTEGLNVSAGYSYTDTEIVDFGDRVVIQDQNGQLVNANEFNGSSFIYVPDSNLNVSAQYTTEAYDGVDFVARVDVAYTGEYFFGIDNVDRFGEKQGGYTLTNIRLSLEAEQWRVTGFVNNAGDKFHAKHAWVGRQVGLPNGAITPGNPQIIGAEVSYSF